jgi:hypothetical protein
MLNDEVKKIKLKKEKKPKSIWVSLLNSRLGSRDLNNFIKKLQSSNSNISNVESWNWEKKLNSWDRETPQKEKLKKQRNLIPKQPIVKW